MGPMTSSTRLMQQKLLINRLLAKKGRKGMAQGFTLIELMIVVAIIGILSAVAIPQFLGVRDRSAVSAKVGEMIGLAKECSVGQVTKSAQKVNIGASGITGLATPFECSGTSVPLAYAFATNNVVASGKMPVGVKCLSDSSTATDTTATVTIDPDGNMTCAWS